MQSIQKTDFFKVRQVSLWLGGCEAEKADYASPEKKDELVPSSESKQGKNIVTQQDV